MKQSFGPFCFFPLQLTPFWGGGEKKGDNFGAGSLLRHWVPCPWKWMSVAETASGQGPGRKIHTLERGLQRHLTLGLLGWKSQMGTQLTANWVPSAVCMLRGPGEPARVSLVMENSRQSVVEHPEWGKMVSKIPFTLKFL